MLYVFNGVWPVQVLPLLHSSALLNPAHGDVRYLPSFLTITCNFVSLLTVSSAHTKTKKTKSVNLCSAQLISAQLRRAHGQKTNKKTGPRTSTYKNIARLPFQTVIGSCAVFKRQGQMPYSSTKGGKVSFRCHTAYIDTPRPLAV